MKKIHICLTRHVKPEETADGRRVDLSTTAGLKNINISKQTEIHIYDKTTTPKGKNKKISVKDHINKTGENILIERTTKKKNSETES